MREAQILTALQEQDYLKADQLAELLGVSSRTIRNDLQELMTAPQGFAIEKSYKLGYHLTVTDEEEFAEYLTAFDDNPIEMQKDRLDSLLVLLLISEEHQTIQQLSDQLLVSPSQVKKDLSKLETYLGGSSLELERKAHYGIRIIGSLKNRLLLLVDRYQRGNKRISEELETAFSAEKRKRLQEELYRLIGKQEWEIDYIEFRRLEEELLLLLLIKGSTTADVPTETYLSQLLQDTGIAIPTCQEAHDYFEASMLARTKKLEIRSNSELLKEKLQGFFQDLDQEQKTHFAEDQEFMQMVYLHVAALIERSRKEVTFNNPYLEQITKEYPTIFNYAVLFAKWLGETFQLEIPAGEIGYLATHMTVPYHKRQQSLIENIYRIAVVCSSGGGMAYLVEMKLRRIFPHAKIQTFSMFEVEKITEYYPDLVFSIIELKLELECPVILISEIQSELDYLEVSENLDLLQREENFSIERTFFDLFDEQYFVIEKSRPYHQILADLADKLETSIAYPGYRESMLERENYLATVYQNGVAIPHPLMMQGQENRIAVCLLPEGATEAERNPKLVFMVSLKEKQLEVHQLISKELGKLMNHPSAIDILVKSNNFQEFYYTLKKVLGRRNQSEY